MLDGSLVGRPNAGPIFTLVPGSEAIELVAYYPELSNYYADCELQTKRWFVENVRPDWIIFDVGANIGYYSILFARLAPKGRVYAFEPTATTDLLQRNLAHHRLTNVETLRIALGAASGVMEEDIYRIWGHAPERMKYDFATLDDMAGRLGLERLDCIKIDVDSFDFDVLRGARDTLERFNPWIAVELNHALAKRNHSPSAALEWLIGRGYRKVFVTDYENFILRRDAGTASSFNASAIELSFDERPLFMPSRLMKDIPVASLVISNYRQHNESEVEFDRDVGRLQMTIPGPIWSYAVSWPMPVDARTSGAIVVEVTLQVFDGAIGIGCAASDCSSYCGEEIIVSPSAVLQTASVLLEDPSNAEYLILRNADAAGATAHARISSIAIFRTKPRTFKGSSLLCPKRRRLLLTECERVLRGAELEQSSSNLEGDCIDVVPVAELHRAFGFARPFVPEIKIYRHTLAEFKTEIDESAIYSYIYELAKPRRHLEFGTWEGFGVTLCARSSSAEIWTINLPDGETDAMGNALYSCNNFDGANAEHTLAVNTATDSGDSIGWRYRAAGYGNRVHQILCDSRDFDGSAFGSGFFDTILIDGGHTSDVVQSDTEKALPLLRSGGIMIWHDFCPDPDAVKMNETLRGVIRAIVDNFADWRPKFSRMFWIQPSWILIGLKI